MYDFYENEEENQLVKIDYSKKLYEDQAAKVKKEQRICELLHKDYISTIRNFKSRYDYVDIFDKAQSQVGERLKRDRPQLEALKHLIVDDFLGNDKTFKLTNITSCGWENYGWNVEFTGYGETFYIGIPIRGKLTAKNIDHMHHGMFSFAVKEGNYCWSIKKTSYEIETLAKFIKEYFESKSEENEDA